MTARSDLALNAALAFAATAVALGAAEGLARLRLPATPPRFVADALTTYRGNPAHPDMNALGFGDIDHPPREPGLLVYVLGGSTSFGRTNWPRLLDERDARVSVHNFGLPGFTTVESLATFEARSAERRPDLVLVHHAVNDLMPRLYERVEADYGHYRKPFEPWRPPLHWSRLASWARRRLGQRGRLTEAATTLFDGPQRNPVRASGLAGAGEAFEHNLDRIVDAIEVAGALPILTTLPHSRDPQRLPVNWSIAPDDLQAGLQQHNSRVRQLAVRRGIALIELDGAMRDERWFRDHVHCTPEGRAEKARLVAESAAFNEAIASRAEPPPPAR